MPQAVIALPYRLFPIMELGRFHMLTVIDTREIEGRIPTTTIIIAG
jgi:hypothetical protein